MLHHGCHLLMVVVCCRAAAGPAGGWQGGRLKNTKVVRHRNNIRAPVKHNVTVQCGRCPSHAHPMELRGFEVVSGGVGGEGQRSSVRQSSDVT